jgi:hypothetical protein
LHSHMTLDFASEDTATISLSILLTTKTGTHKLHTSVVFSYFLFHKLLL